jgi:hypothetical protein
VKAQASAISRRAALPHQTIRIALLLLPVWILGAGELSQFVWKNAVPGPLERTGMVKGRDFVQFYVAGSLARDGRWAELYDVIALKQAVTEIVPPGQGFVPAPVYPPHVALFFHPWAGAPYLTARWSWLALSVIAYVAGTALVIRRLRLSGAQRAMLWLMSVLNPAFAMAITTGQLSVVAMLAWALAISAQFRGRMLLCGAYLGLLAYKPPLLFGVLLVLLVTGGRAILAGILLCGTAQAVATVVASGFSPWAEYLRSLTELPAYYYLTDTLPHQKQSLLGFFQLLLGSGPLLSRLVSSCSGGSIERGWIADGSCLCWRRRACC